MRAGLCLRYAAARLRPDPAWAHRVREDPDGREPRPCPVVSPSVSGRRVAALRPRQPQPVGLARALPWSHLRPRRHAGRLGGAGGLVARAEDLSKATVGSRVPRQRTKMSALLAGW